MSTAARKARKRAGIPFTKAQKVPTPVEERQSTKRAVDSMLRRVMRSIRGTGAPVTDEAIEAALKSEAGR